VRLSAHRQADVAVDMMQEANHVFELNVRLFSSFEPLVETAAADSRAVFIRTESSPSTTGSSTPRDTPNRIAIVSNPFAALVGPSTPLERSMVVPVVETPRPLAAWVAPAIVVAGAALAVCVALLFRSSEQTLV